MKTDKRKHTRVDLPLLVKLTFFNNPNEVFLGKDISVSGMSIATHLNITTGTNCLVELKYNQPDELISREISGKVVRNNKNGFCLQFIRMEYEAYIMLQTELLYSCDNPSTLCEEFSDSCPVTIIEKRRSSKSNKNRLSN